MEGIFSGVDPRVILAVGGLTLLVVVGLIVVTSWLDSRRDEPRDDDRGAPPR